MSRVKRHWKQWWMLWENKADFLQPLFGFPSPNCCAVQNVCIMLMESPRVGFCPGVEESPGKGTSGLVFTYARLGAPHQVVSHGTQARSEY